MEFYRVAEIFEHIGMVTSRTTITKYLAELFSEATPHEAAILSYLSLGMLRAPYIGTQFNFAEKNLITVIAKLLNKSQKEIEEKSKELGDIGSVLEMGSWPIGKKLTLLQVHKHLTELEEISGIGSQEEKAASVLVLLKELDPRSAKYVVRMILGVLRLGFSDMTILDALSWTQTGDKSLKERLEGAYNICADIGLIAQTLKGEGIKALDHMKVKVGIPIRPAAAERMPTPANIIKKIGPCIAQPKLDGFRLQIHLDKTHAKPKVHFFSRNLIDMSFMFPDLVKELEKLDITSMIADGEAITYDPVTGNFLPFQETVKRKRKHGIDAAISEYPLRVFVFDLLMLDGKDLLNDTHEQRRNKLEQVFKHFKNDAIALIEEKKCNNADELNEYFLKNVAQGLEGIVAKRPDSIYQAGKRNFNWIKLKRIEAGHLEDTIDCVLLGYYTGSGKRAQFGIGALLAGVYNKKKDCFQTIAKVGSGFTDEGWKDLRKRCENAKVASKPINVEISKELVPDVWVSPEIVCTIRADEITLSPLHTAGKTEKHLGYALRFPRFINFRSDKTPEQATEIDEVAHLYKDQFKK